MTAKFDKTGYYDLDRTLLIEAVEIALKQCEFKIVNVDEMSGIIDAKATISPFSWSENIVVIIEDDGEVYMKSECALPTQIFDSGKNKKNVEDFFKRMNGMGLESDASGFV